MKKFLESGKQARIRSGSLGSLEDQGKRKREGEIEEYEEKVVTAFKRSNLVRRSPAKAGNNSEMEEVLKRLEDIRIELKEIKESNKDLKNNYNKLLEEVKSTHNLLRMENEGLKKEVQEMKGKILQLEKKEESREKEERKNNIIVTFRPDKASSKNKEDIQKCAKEVCKKIGEDDIDVERKIEEA